MRIGQVHSRSVRPGPLGARLAAGWPLVLDGATGTELHRRGVSTALPLWSAIGLIERPEVLRAIHLDYVRAGADILVTNTFRTNRRTLERAGLTNQVVKDLPRRAVALAQEARAAGGRADVLIAGSLAPLEDCYSPWLSPPFETALAEHREQARLLAEASVDFLLVETMPVAAEAEAAVIAAREAGLETVVSFVCAVDSEERVRLLSGEMLSSAVGLVRPHEPVAILVNCAAPPVILAGIEELRRLTDLPIGGYANLGHVEETEGWRADASVTGDAYAAAAAGWLDAGALLVGGCCGTRPEHIAALRSLVDQRSSRIGATRRPE